jgi:hypothetical protein
MDKRLAGLLGAAATLGTLGTAQAASGPATEPSEVLQAGSYADLLQPIPNAAATLKVIDEGTPMASAEPKVQLAQMHHHHHHHHHHHFRRHRHHHHHHHHRH